VSAVMTAAHTRSASLAEYSDRARWARPILTAKDITDALFDEQQ
jgi:hypothetical protein